TSVLCGAVNINACERQGVVGEGVRKLHIFGSILASALPSEVMPRHLSEKELLDALFCGCSLSFASFCLDALFLLPQMMSTYQQVKLGTTDFTRSALL
ncbi:hypothetical protein FHG87_021744, partial [Trinorchestia longiramus]